MKKLVVAAMALLFVFTFAASSQTPKKHRVVFQMISQGPDAWNSLMGNLQNIRAAFAPEPVEIEVVSYGKGLTMLLKTNTTFEERIKKFAEEGVIFAACQNSMRIMKLTPEDLFPVSTPVDSGVAEVVRKQEAGWSYVKAGE